MLRQPLLRSFSTSALTASSSQRNWSDPHIVQATPLARSIADTRSRTSTPELLAAAMAETEARISRQAETTNERPSRSALTRRPAGKPRDPTRSTKLPSDQRVQGAARLLGLQTPPQETRREPLSLEEWERKQAEHRASPAQRQRRAGQQQQQRPPRPRETLDLLSVEAGARRAENYGRPPRRTSPRGGSAGGGGPRRANHAATPSGGGGPQRRTLRPAGAGSSEDSLPAESTESASASSTESVAGGSVAPFPKRVALPPSGITLKQFFSTRPRPSAPASSKELAAATMAPMGGLVVHAQPNTKAAQAFATRVLAQNASVKERERKVFIGELDRILNGGGAVQQPSAAN